MCIITMLSIIWAINSEGECLLDVEKVIGSNPILPTIGGAVEHWGLFVYSTGFVASIPLPTP
jgi:hypothetical protein